MMFAPGGGFAKGAARLGVLNPRSRYHMGIGQHRNMMQNKGGVTQNKATSEVNSYIPDGRGGRVNLRELY